MSTSNFIISHLSETKRKERITIDEFTLQNIIEYDSAISDILLHSLLMSDNDKISEVAIKKLADLKLSFMSVIIDKLSE